MDKLTLEKFNEVLDNTIKEYDDLMYRTPLGLYLKKELPKRLGIKEEPKSFDNIDDLIKWAKDKDIKPDWATKKMCTLRKIDDSNFYYQDEKGDCCILIFDSEDKWTKIGDESNKNRQGSIVVT